MASQTANQVKSQFKKDLYRFTVKSLELRSGGVGWGVGRVSASGGFTSATLRLYDNLLESDLTYGIPLQYESLGVSLAKGKDKLSNMQKSTSVSGELLDYFGVGINIGAFVIPQPKLIFDLTPESLTGPCALLSIGASAGYALGGNFLILGAYTLVAGAAGLLGGVAGLVTGGALNSRTAVLMGIAASGRAMVFESSSGMASGGLSLEMGISTGYCTLLEQRPTPKPPKASPVAKVPMPLGQKAPRVGYRVHTVVAGESLSGIAMTYYGSYSKTRMLHAVNHHKIGNNPNYITPGMELVIPPRSAG